jgi:hypothetical protein
MNRRDVIVGIPSFYLGPHSEFCPISDRLIFNMEAVGLSFAVKKVSGLVQDGSKSLSFKTCISATESHKNRIAISGDRCPFVLLISY